ASDPERGVERDRDRDGQQRQQDRVHGVGRRHRFDRRPEAVLEGLVEDHRHRGQQQQAEVAEGEAPKPPSGGGAGGQRTVLRERVPKRTKRLTRTSSSSEIASRTTETAAAPEMSP